MQSSSSSSGSSSRKQKVAPSSIDAIAPNPKRRRSCSSSVSPAPASSANPVSSSLRNGRSPSSSRSRSSSSQRSPSPPDHGRRTNADDDDVPPGQSSARSSPVVDDSDVMQDPENTADTPTVSQQQQQQQQQHQQQPAPASNGNGNGDWLSGDDHQLDSGCRRVEAVYERLNTIDEGTYGVVHRARNKKTGEVVALKKVKLNKSVSGFPITSLREINILLQLDHPNIVRVKEVVTSKKLDGVYMVMEYCDHDLKALMQAKKEPFSQSEVKCLMIQLLKSVHYMHKNWVLHRDLKTSNLLFSNKGGILKICDFGMARQYGSPIQAYTNLVCTLWYRAPELLFGAKKYTSAVDMFSVGCIFAEFLTSKPLFPGKGEMEQIDKLMKLLGTPNDKRWRGFSKLPHAKQYKWKQYPNKLRDMFPAQSFHGGPWLSEAGFNLLSGLLHWDPERRMSADEALNHPWFKEPPRPQDPALMPTFPGTGEKKRHHHHHKHAHKTKKPAAAQPKPAASAALKAQSSFVLR